ncbi:hypothetical protein J4E80_008046 [Alternaria sp. BMP 0032]|nr:hypothetical protein J4E80_008046 [Alternaria sp. BMP 0032]
MAGLPRVWITYCFGPELAEDLINDGRIKLEPGPVDDRPRLELTDFDVQIAEAAGFHRAMNIWNELAYYGNGEEVKNTLHEQATTLARLLDSCDIEDSSSLPGKFKDFATLRCPHPFTSGDLMSSVPQSSYYDEFLKS